jgi:hypothetical protein
MATWEDVSRLALALPEAEEAPTAGGRHRAWTVRAPKRLVHDYLARTGGTYDGTQEGKHPG